MALLDIETVSKSFDGFQALSAASFSAKAGEVHALLGENGAGKSSLMNVVAGLYRPDSGRIRIKGEDVSIDDPITAKRLGVGMVHQHFKLVRSFNAIENILLASSAEHYSSGTAEVERAVRANIEQLDFELDLTKPVGLLSVAEQQRVEIVKVLINEPNILILDEPSAVLTDAEAEGLLRTMRKLASRGAAVVLVTHKLGEVKAFADRVTIMRRGKTVTTIDPNTQSVADLTALIVGELVAETRHPAQAIGSTLLFLDSVSGCRSDGHRSLVDASLKVRSGEIYGIAGVGGNGQTELAEIIMGVRSPTGGRIEFIGLGDVTGAGAGARRDFGLVSIPADRQAYALAGDLSIGDNYSVHGVRTGVLGGWARVDANTAKYAAETAVKAFDVQGVRAVRQRAGLLSGGNAQKLVIAREFASQPRVVIAHSPSRGLDVRATSDVHRRLLEARDAGAAVLLISEDLDEILLLSDRIGVMSGGRIVREFDTPADRQDVGKAMVHHD